MASASDPIRLDQLGPRISIMGPSNSGKSTLAVAIAKQGNVPLYHLDQLYFQPGFHWQPRPAGEFEVLHAKAIEGEHWIIEGNFSPTLSARLERATGLILLDVPISTSLYRYLRRCWWKRDRLGGLEGCRDHVAWEMLHYIIIEARRARKRHREIFESLNLPKIYLGSTEAIECFYDSNGLTM